MEDLISRDATSDADADSPPIELVVPTALSCAHPRVGRVGGTARIHPNWSPLSVTPDITTMTVPNWGLGTVRSVATQSAVTFHRRIGSFETLSVKTGRIVSGLGPHEQINFEELEVSPQIVEFDLQGLRTSWEPEPTYLADFHALHVTDGIVAGEVKADRSYFLDPGYSPTMANARRTLGAVGITFHEVDGTSLNRNQTRRRNVRRAFVDRFTLVSEQQIDIVHDLLTRDGEVPLGRIHSVLANDSRTAQLLVHALLCRRVISYDLELPVNRETLVTIPAAPTIAADIHNIELSEAA